MIDSGGKTEASARVSGLTRALGMALVAASCGYILLLLVVVALRIGHPYKLEWMEDITLAHVARVTEGGALFGAPAAEFTPSFYTPLYYYLAAPAEWIGGYRLAPIRAFSFLLSLLCFGLIFQWARKETGCATHGLLAAGIAAATYREGGAWFDLARIDMLFILLALAVGYILRFHARPGKLIGYVAAGLVLAVAYFAKQTALILAMPWVAATLVAERRGGVAFTVSFLVGVVAPHLALDALSRGWFGYYTVKMLFGQPISPKHIAGFWYDDLLPALPVALLAAASLLLRWRKTDRERAIFYLFTGAAFVGAAWSSRIKAGGYINVNITAHFILAIAFAVGLHEAEKLARGGRRPVRALALVRGLALFQFVILIYDPRPLIPTAADRAAGDRVVQAIREIDGPVYAPFNPLYAEMAGKARLSHALPLVDIVRAEPGEIGKQARAILEDPIRASTFAAIVLDSKRTDLMRMIRYEYRVRVPLHLNEEDLFPPTGWRTRPEEISLPAPAGEPAAVAIPPGTR